MNGDEAYLSIPNECKTGDYVDYVRAAERRGDTAPSTPATAPPVPPMDSLLVGRYIVTAAWYSMLFAVGFIVGLRW